MILVEPLSSMPAERRSYLVGRNQNPLDQLLPAVDAIIARVRSDRDAALREYTRQFDGVAVDALIVPRETLQDALAAIPADLRSALEQAAAAIEAFHVAQIPEREMLPVTTNPGVQVWRTWRAIERVGLYAPGGRARYPSTVLMTAIPAKVAGCQEIILCTPPDKDGTVPQALLAAAAIAGVTRVCMVGGAQAIAAMAYGTESVPRVDKIVGPGNSYVTAAKLRVALDCAIDGPAGPSEVLIIADDTANAAFIASDILAQAEHGPDSACLLVTPSASLAESVSSEIERQLALLPRADLIRLSLDRFGALIVTSSLDEAIAFANDFAAEHLEIITGDDDAVLREIRHAGSIFLGNWSPVASGDYATGSNHTLATAGFARSFPPLSTETYGRWLQVQRASIDGLAGLRGTIVRLATEEGLTAHSASIETRFTVAMDAVNIADRLARPIILDANENPYGPSPQARLALANASRQTNRYPDMAQRQVRAALARANGIASEQVIVGNGSDEIIHLLTLATTEPGDEVIVCEPTFGVYRMEADRAGLRTIDVPLLDDFSLDRAALLAAITPRTRMIWLCSPNNPTGTIIDLSILPELLSRDVLVVMDEAYYPYGDQTAIGSLANAENLIIMRTMSKLAGMAGLRAGYAMAHPAVIARMEARRAPFNLNRMVEDAILAFLQDAEWQADVKQRTERERERMQATLSAIPGARVCPSVANFFLTGIDGLPGADLRARLAEKGILVRYIDRERLQGYIRVTVGRPEENDAFLAAFAAICVDESKQPDLSRSSDGVSQEVFR
jgi:histidinol dehydrogenase